MQDPIPEVTSTPVPTTPPDEGEVLGVSRVPKTGDTGDNLKMFAGLFFLAVSAASFTMVVKKKEEDEE